MKKPAIERKRLKTLLTTAFERSGLRRPDLVKRVGTWRKMDSGLKRVLEVLHGFSPDREFIGKVARALNVSDAQVDAAITADEAEREEWLRPARERYHAWLKVAEEPIMPTCMFDVPMMTVWAAVPLPAGLTRDEAIEHARKRAMSMNRRVVLRAFRHFYLMAYPDGHTAMGQPGCPMNIPGTDIPSEFAEPPRGGNHG